MKKANLWFWGQSVIIVILLGIIAILLKDRQSAMMVGNGDYASAASLSENSQTAQEREGVISLKELQERNRTEVSSEQTVKEPEKKVPEKISDEEIQIVVFGDSIWNAERGKDGISEQVMEQIDVKIYNCAIGGTTAAVDGESTNSSNWTSTSFNGMMYIATDIVHEDALIPNAEAWSVFKEIEFEEVDYVIVSYGLNDYFCDIPVYPKEYYDMTSYIGALRHGVQKIKEEYPNIEFILTSPTYCGWFSGERQYELGTYVEAARSVAQEMDLNFLDMYHALGKNPDEKNQYLEDGVHLTAEGRSMYAHSVVEYLKQLEQAKNKDA